MSFFEKLNRFANNPVNVNHRRSKFNLSHKLNTTFNSGKLIPLLCDEVLPGDTIKIDLSTVIRMVTPALPVMDDAYLDIFAFWCPARILTCHEKDWEKIHGENTAGFWAPSTESTLDNTGNTFYLSAAVTAQSLGDYFGLPIGYYKAGQILSRLPFNGYWCIWDNWFRDENTQAPTGWKSYGQTSMNDFVNGASDGVMPVNKLHDYFTSALPSPQKGASVLLPMAGSAPVKTSSTDNTFTASERIALHLKAVSSGSNPSNLLAGTYNGNLAQGTSSQTVSSGTATMYPSNLYADLTNATAATVNDLRQAFAIQKLLEKDARGGTRYREMLYAHYAVSIPDNTIQIPEYLGGKRVPLNMMQVLQTSENGSSPLGTTGAFSNTSDSSYLFTKSFAEFGYIYILCCVRPNQSYCQGISKMFTRNRRYDWYYPVFANLGEQAIHTYELYATNATDFTEVFGYQEAWAEYRYKPNKITGYTSKVSGDVVAGAWTYANYFTAKPVLNSSFMKQDKSNIGNTLVSTSGSYQFILDAYVNYTAWREMPYFSIPGLIDHH